MNCSIRSRIFGLGVSWLALAGMFAASVCFVQAEQTAPAAGAAKAQAPTLLPTSRYRKLAPDVLKTMLEKGRAEGIETRGISDHGFIDSIYFRDPNGYVIELTARQPNHAEATDPTKNAAREKLARWQASKRAPQS